jgi:serine/threonine-protein kinase
VSTGPAGKAIPTVAGLTTSQAKTALTNEGFKVGDTIEQASNDVEEGRVIGTDPTGKAPPGSTVNLIVSSGAQQVAVPAVKGQTEAEATATLRAKGLGVEVDPTTLPAGDPNVGRVIEVDPKAGTMVDPGSTVTITVGVAGSTTTVAPSGASAGQSSTTTAP